MKKGDTLGGVGLIIGKNLGPNEVIEPLNFPTPGFLLTSQVTLKTDLGLSLLSYQMRKMNCFLDPSGMDPSSLQLYHQSVVLVIHKPFTEVIEHIF